MAIGQKILSTYLLVPCDVMELLNRTNFTFNSADSHNKTAMDNIADIFWENCFPSVTKG